jgi:hypothetical protein
MTSPAPRIIVVASSPVLTCICDWDCPSGNSRPCENPIRHPDGLCDHCHKVTMQAQKTQEQIFHCHTCGISAVLW